MKNLLTGYFHSPSNKQSDVLRLIANVIGFTDVRDADETKLEHSALRNVPVRAVIAKNVLF